MSDTLIKRSFVPGEEWVYYKFYCGAKTGDKVLEEAIIPAIERLKVNNLIDQWFFIRYADPDLHLRVRLHCSDVANIGEIIQTIYRFTQKMVEQELVWKVLLDTYQRELERYGANTMELSEQLFFFDSELFVKVLPYFRNTDGEVVRWLFALKSIDALLDSFQFSLDDKLLLLQELKSAFGKEFGMDQFLKGQLDAKFRKDRSLIEQALDSTSEKDSLIATLLNAIHEQRDVMKPIVLQILSMKQHAQLDIPFNDLMGSYIHMLVNRIFKSKQRMHEMVLYDFLYRYYKSTVARAKKHEGLAKAVKF
ncbi:thiopeptide-type bacteriocin biosynthesis protein [Williamwhitmania taraxaci]|uniref:Thiopeptide-type bacteriocin biosynthesis domain-containing protein n=1 Tax=Williamwhitmania taraxaci TaxID=1640674 RepID=A0A1G6TGC3_9BACT|nr:thiopeptide-type bacteriocin biosynthesis protein [Williamwhitmania taraxaci]SDD27566.1 thiopeptide-type bacteriocin biosynthesis domain-containing protein [Williamwhitmania taraxaci]